MPKRTSEAGTGYRPQAAAIAAAAPQWLATPAPTAMPGPRPLLGAFKGLTAASGRLWDSAMLTFRYGKTTVR